MMKAFSTALLLFLALAGHSQSIKWDIPKNMNVLWLVCEDQSMFFAPYGDSIANTPNINRLANEGIVFDNAFTTSAVCSPSRSAIITGQHPFTIGTMHMRAFNPWLKQPTSPTTGLPNYSAVTPPETRFFTEYLREQGYYCSNNPKEDYNMEMSPLAWDESSNKAHWRNRDGNQPFFSVFNFDVTHESKLWKNRDKEITVNSNVIEVPPIFPDNEQVRKELAVNYSNIERLDQEIGAVLEQLEEDSLLESTMVIFYSDHGGPFPRYKRDISDRGLHIPFIIRLPQQALKGTRTNRMTSMVDLAPTMLNIAGSPIPDHFQGQSFFNETHTPEYIIGSSDRFDECYDRFRCIRSESMMYVKNFYPDTAEALNVGYRKNTLIMEELEKGRKAGTLDKDQQAWFATPKPQEALYDIGMDPYQLNNLVNDPAHADILAELKKAYTEFFDMHGDLGSWSERDLIDKYLPKGVQTKCSQPVVKDGEIMARQPGARVGWRYKNDKVWHPYQGKDQLDTLTGVFEFASFRLGYKSSETLDISQLPPSGKAKFTGVIVEEPFVNKAGRKIPGVGDLYFRYRGTRYFIKFMDSKVSRDEAKKLKGKRITITGEIKEGLWDTDDPYVQSRVGTYMAIYRVE